MIDALIHKQEQLFLTFRRQTVDFIQKQQALIGEGQQPFAVLFRSGVRAFCVAKQAGQKKIRIVGILRAVHRDQLPFLSDQPLLPAVIIQLRRKQAFAAAGRSMKQNR